MEKLLIIFALALLMNSCSWLTNEKEERLSGNRIAILKTNRSLSPDPASKNIQIHLPPPTINDSWPQAGGYANHAMHHLKISDKIKKKWSIDIGKGTDDDYRLSSGPIVADQKIFTMDAETLVSAFKFDTGSQIWEINLTPNNEDDGHVNGGLAYGAGLIFATTGFGQVIAIEANTGKLVWRKIIGTPFRAAPTYRGGRVFAQTLNNEIYALNSKTGKELWKHSGVPEVASILGAASPAVGEGVVVVPYSSGQLVALRVDNGRVLWEENLSSIRRTKIVSALSDIRGRPIIDRGKVIAISHGGQIVGIDLKTGTRIWDRKIGGLESPWVSGNYIFTLTNEAEVICLSRETGSVIWVQRLPRYENQEKLKDQIIWTGPLLASDRLIVSGSNGEALAISPYSGKILGFIEMPDSISIPPIIANTNILFLTNNAELIVYH